MGHLLSPRTCKFNLSSSHKSKCNLGVYVNIDLSRVTAPRQRAQISLTRSRILTSAGASQRPHVTTSGSVMTARAAFIVSRRVRGRKRQRQRGGGGALPISIKICVQRGRSERRAAARFTFY
ncbi:hypothetical protein EVAR_97958_1 [Eumeta japonica]|uniref:Uncharacterized protein n=1 Tax=Eumeta variegata TaxID=151549 RepID=A0A4C1XHU2_EUMVA|nr:hypothetical protein EVAR_97958_1 [Eumeta japonica]